MKPATPDPTTKRGLLAMILGKLGQMAAVQERHSTMLAAIIEKIACNDSQPPPEGLPELPLQNVEDFCKCDEMLASNPDIYTYLRKRLSSVGGKTPTILAKNIMKGLLTNDIGRRFNWAGKDKFAFKDTTAKKMIFDAVYRVFENHSSDELNDVAISGALKTWLKMAPARYEYNLKRTFPKS